jgi:hypothetical protein
MARQNRRTGIAESSGFVADVRERFLHRVRTMRGRGLLTLLLLVPLLGWITAGTTRAEGEIVVEASYLSDDYGSGESSSIQALTLRYITGNKLQVRVDVPFLRAEVPAGAVHAPIGPLPGGLGGGPHGSGSSGTNDIGSGNGNGGGATMQGSPGDPGAADSYPAEWTTSLGDIRLGLSRQFAGGGVKLYRTDAVLEVKAPTTDAESGLGTGEWDARIGVAGEYRFWSATAFGGVGWNRLGDPEWVELRDPVDVYAGAESEPLAGERLVLSGWVAGHQEALAGLGPTAAVGLSLRAVRGLRWRGSITADVVGEYRRVSVLFGISFGVFSEGPGIRGLDR